MINKERLRQAVIKGISQMPSEAVIYRQPLNNYKEPDGEPQKIAEVTGLLYKSSTDRDMSIILKDKGEVVEKHSTKFLTVYNDESSKVKIGDILNIGAERYKIIDPGENFEVYLDMVVELYG